ncbi:hypothetical protein K461DRAFT_324204 [Myriangium duriaei CBS 260.36]|uniref:Apple domain-containing protein n=1 Tax=Myriangium duriaei CBS 260.36 TaxID=1168546 RepID=A0A9P4IXL3_9PEZI|nr:hypothetical protein K461DRAFT_324204 [Myriangium duriaei CBS 260.36]
MATVKSISILLLSLFHVIFVSALPVKSGQKCVNTNPPNFACGKFGHLARPAQISTITTTNLQQCVYECNAEQGCISFGYGNKKCRLYSKTLAAQGLEVQESGKIAYYNRHCFTCSTTPSTTSPVTVTTPPVTATKASTVTAYATVTDVVTATVQVTHTPAPQFTYNGIAWAMYEDIDSSYEALAEKVPDFEGISTTGLGFSGYGIDNTFNAYGSSLPITNLTMIHYGRIVCQSTGDYKFYAGPVEDYWALWIGDVAVNGWKTTPANYTGSYDEDRTDPYYPVASVPCEMGNSIPFRWVYRYQEMSERINFEARIDSPNGTMVSNNTMDTSYFELRGSLYKREATLNLT